MTADEKTVYDWLPVGLDNAVLLSLNHCSPPFGLTKTRAIVWRLARRGLARAYWCGTYGDLTPLGRRYRAWYRE